MNKSIIVYGNNFETACNKLESILENIEVKEITSLCKSVTNERFTIYLENGDSYIALCAYDNARGYRWQYAYIDKSINGEKLNNIVFPKFVPKDENGDIDYNAKVTDYYEWY